MKKAYYYFFYRIYLFSERTSESGYFAELKAVVTIMALELWLALSINNYYSLAIKKMTHLSLSMPIVFIPAAIILFSNVFMFTLSKKWKEYNAYFEAMPAEVNRRWGKICWSIIFFIIINLVLSFYLLYQMKRSEVTTVPRGKTFTEDVVAVRDVKILMKQINRLT